MMTLHIFSGERAVGQLTLPLPPDDFKQKLDDIRGKNQAVKPLYVFNVDGPIPGLGWHLEFTKLEQDAALQKLNQLAETLGHLGTGGLLQLNKVLHTDYRQDLDAILRTASSIRKVNPNSYEFIPDVTTDQALGKWLVEHGQFKAEDYLRPHLNYDSIGFEYRHAHNGAFLTGGYAGVRPGAVEQVVEEKYPLRLTLASLDSADVLRLPASEEDLTYIQDELGIDDFSRSVIANIEYEESRLTQLIPKTGATVEDANELARCLQGIEKDKEMKKYCAALEAEEPSTFSEAVNIAMDLEDYELVDSSEREYALDSLRRMGVGEEIREAIEDYIDFERMGRDMMEEDGVRQTGFGQILRLSKPFPKPEIGPSMC